MTLIHPLRGFFYNKFFLFFLFFLYFFLYYYFYFKFKFDRAFCVSLNGAYRRLPSVKWKLLI